MRYSNNFIELKNEIKSNNALTSSNLLKKIKMIEITRTNESNKLGFWFD